MKGVESIIAIILILMIVIALAALAYTWFTGVFSSLTSTAGTAVTQTTSAMSTQFRIEGVSCNANPCVVLAGVNKLTFIVRNTGTKDLDNAKIIFYIGGKTVTVVGCTATSPAATCVNCASALKQGCLATFSRDVVAGDLPIICGSTVIKATVESGITDSASIKC